MTRDDLETLLDVWAVWRESSENVSEIGYPKRTVESRMKEPASDRPPGPIVPVRLTTPQKFMALDRAYSELEARDREVVRFRFFGSGKLPDRIKAYCMANKCTGRTWRNRYGNVLAFYRGYLVAKR